MIIYTGVLFLFNFKKSLNLKKVAFSLIELMISLIVISLIAAAFVPVITKKLSSSSIFAGSTGSGFSKSCSEIDEDCDLCAGSICLSCKKTCPAGETLNTTSCSCEPKVPYSMAVDGLYVTRFNMGDSSKTKIPAEAGVKVVNAGETCGSATDYSAKCCWQGETSGTDCDATNGDYSGCNRTVCTWAAANAICVNYKQDGKTWRLPTSSEMSNWPTYSINKGNDGLMLCNYRSGYSSAYCYQFDNNCQGSYRNVCNSNTVWSGSFYNSSEPFHYEVLAGSWTRRSDPYTQADSVRCVSEIVSNCETYDSDGETCTACKSGYYLSGKECKKSTEVQNCETYSKTENACATCKDGYGLKNGKCEKIPFYMIAAGLYVTKYNMGDSTETAIPSAAGVTVVNVGQTCGSSDNYSAKCCWKGATSGGDCDSANGSYSGCNRTVCTWAAANAICANYKQDGRTWRLPTTSEVANWGTYSIGKGNNGLMLCDVAAGYNSTNCDNTGSTSCVGSYNGCFSNHIWTSFGSTSEKTAYYLQTGSWKSNSSAWHTHAFSVRCVSEIAPNCKTVSGGICIACNDGYYLSNNQCKARTTVANCATYSPTADKCESCASGYTLKNNTCTFKDNCTDEYFIKIGNLCVTRYNMGDSPETLIPSGANANVVSVGNTCVIDTDKEKVYKGTASKCCWKGNTAQDCDSSNGSYSGCNRTVCDYAAAKAICENFNKKGYSWRLPTTNELNITQLGNQIMTINLGNSGLMLCDTGANYGSSQCSAGSEKCIGTDAGKIKNTCSPANIWLEAYSKFHRYGDGTTYYIVNPYYYYLENTYWRGPTIWNYVPKAAYSVRCVADMI